MSQLSIAEVDSPVQLRRNLSHYSRPQSLDYNQILQQRKLQHQSVNNNYGAISPSPIRGSWNEIPPAAVNKNYRNTLQLPLSGSQPMFYYLDQFSDITNSRLQLPIIEGSSTRTITTMNDPDLLSSSQITVNRNSFQPSLAPPQRNVPEEDIIAAITSQMGKTELTSVEMAALSVFTPKLNRYQQKKNLAEGLMDIALLSANANQLRYVMQFFDKEDISHIVCIVLIAISIVLQVVVGVGLCLNSRCDVTRTEGAKEADMINDWTVAGVFLITIVNVFVAAYGIPDANR